MDAKLIIVPEVEQDLVEAFAWYESRRDGLGREFLSCVEACIAAISRMPEMYGIVQEAYRRALVRRFPFAVFYEYSAGTGIRLRCLPHSVRSRQVETSSSVRFQSLRRSLISSMMVSVPCGQRGSRRSETLYTTFPEWASR